MKTPKNPSFEISRLSTGLGFFDEMFVLIKKATIMLIEDSHLEQSQRLHEGQNLKTKDWPATQ